MGVGLGAHPGVVDGLCSLGCANFCKGGGQDPHGSDIGLGGGENAGSDIMGLGTLSCANFCKDGGQTPHGSDIGVRGSGGGDRTIGGSGKRRSPWPRGSVGQFLSEQNEKAEDRNHDMAMEVQKVLDYLRHEESYAAETQAVEPKRSDLGASHSAHHQGFRLGDRRRHKRVCASDAGPPSARSSLSGHKKSAKSRLGGAS